MTTSIDTDTLRDQWPNTGHLGTARPTHCDTCGVRLPCDWSLILDDLHACLDRIDDLEKFRTSVMTVYGQ